MTTRTISMAAQSRPRDPASPFSQAIALLRSRGASVEPSDIMGLTMVDGRELTIGQVIDAARQTPRLSLR